MSHSERCPVRGGAGIVKVGGFGHARECHGCGGRGWVTVSDGRDLNPQDHRHRPIVRWDHPGRQPDPGGRYL